MKRCQISSMALCLVWGLATTANTAHATGASQHGPRWGIGAGHGHFWPEPVAEAEQFVRTFGPSFTVGFKPHKVVGSNNYYPMYSSEFMVDALFEKAAASGFNTMRTWGFFAIGTPDSDEVPTLADGDKGVYFEYWDIEAGAPAFNDGANGLEKLDYLVYKAKQEGLRLILPLTNNWAAFGGIDQYNIWADHAFHSDFYTEEATRTWFKEWISHLLNRVNVYTNVAYKDEPAIMAFELANEPRCVGSGGIEGEWGSGLFPRDPDCTAETLLPWVEEMSAYIKSLDSNHLVSTGDEGFYNNADAEDWLDQGGDGVDTIAFSSVDSIDYMSLHLYPDQWGGRDAEWGAEWIQRHNYDAWALGKPALLGEFGWSDKATRNPTYKLWLDASLMSGGAGALYWILSDLRDDESVYPDYDGYTVYCPSPVCSTIQNYGTQLENPWTPFPPVADDDTVTTPFGTPTSASVVDNDISYFFGLDVRVDTVDLDPDTEGRQTSFGDETGSWSVDEQGVVSVTPAEGYAGKIAIEYTVDDYRGWPSNIATFYVVVEPDPNAALVLFDFEDGLQGWECSGDAVASVENGELHILGNDWCTSTFDTPLDLSGKTQIKVDFVATDSGVNPQYLMQLGSGWDWCEMTPAEGTWTDPRVGENAVVIDLDQLSDECYAGLSEVHTFGMWTHEGNHVFDNILAN